MDDAAAAASLGSFLSRPVVIDTFTWLESDSTGIKRTVLPWHLFLSNPVISRKIANYAFLRGNLHLKIMINASPFYFGAMYAAYQPLQNFTPSTIVIDGSSRHFIPYSQRPGLWVWPQKCEGGEMVLPFFNPRNWLRLGTAAAVQDMGQLDFIIYSDLDSANGVTNSGATVQVLAWMEDVVLSGPTVDVQLQSDEYSGNGQVSAPASTVARIARYFTGIPIIGKFAKATEIGANAISGIATMFGYTNVPVIRDVIPYAPRATPMLASPHISFPLEKLTLDPKNELSIDPKTVGHAIDVDELAIEYLVSRESYLTTATWTNATAVDTILFSSRITPFMYDFNGGGINRWYGTPVAWVSDCFEHWRGDLIFRFKIVCSKYHKGRLRISYDPAGKTANSLYNTVNSTQTVYTKIVDIGETDDVEIRVPYQQALPFLAINNAKNTGNIPFSLSATPTFSYDDTRDNGVITVRVFNALTAPVLATTVRILVFVRAAENFELANPANVGSTVSTFAIQGDITTVPKTSQEYTAEAEHHVMGASPPTGLPERYLTNFGESVKSLRPLLRRMQLIDTVRTSIAANTNEISMLKIDQTRFPPMFGYDPNGIYSAKGINVPASTFNFNWCNPTFFSWIAPAFIGHRGSFNWTFLPERPDNVGNISANRIPTASITPAITRVNFAQGTLSVNAANYYNEFPATCGGVAVTHQSTNAGLSVSLPNYTSFKFQSTSPTTWTRPVSSTTSPAYDGGDTDCSRIIVTGNNSIATSSTLNTSVWRYAGVGTDYTLFYFLNVPTFYQYPSTPAP